MADPVGNRRVTATGVVSTRLDDVSASRVVVGFAAVDDLDAVNDIYNHYVRTSAATFDVEPRSMDWRRGWYDAFAERGRHRLLVAREGPLVLGYASSSPYRDRPAYDPSVLTSVYVDPARTGGGIGRALYDALLSELEAEDVHRAYAGITMPNPASVRLHERCGFRRVGYFSEQGRKFGRFWDVAWYQRAVPADA
jgi:phosphinothricin acetyltransferase